MVGNMVGNKIIQFQDRGIKYKKSTYNIDLIDYKLVAGEGFEPSNFGL